MTPRSPESNMDSPIDTRDASPGGDGRHCRRCGRLIFMWERQAGVFHETKQGVVCIDCVQAANPTAAESIRKRATRRMNGKAADSRRAERTATPAKTPVVSPASCRGRTYAALALLVVMLAVAAYVITGGYHRQNGVPAAEPDVWAVPPGGEEPVMAIHSDHTVTGCVLGTPNASKTPAMPGGDMPVPAPSDPAGVSDDHDKNKAAAERYARIIGGLMPDADLPACVSTRDALLKMASDYAGTRAADQAAARARRLSGRIDAMLETRFRKSTAMIRYLQSTGDYMTADKLIHFADRELKAGSTECIGRFESELNTLRTANDTFRKQRAVLLKNDARRALVQKQYDTVETLILAKVADPDPLSRTAAETLYDEYMSTLEKQSVGQTVENMARFRILNEAFAQFDDYLSHREYLAAASYAANFAATRSGKGDADERATFQTAADCAKRLMTLSVTFVKLNETNLAENVIDITDTNGDRYEGRFRGVSPDGLLSLASTRARDADGAPVVMTIPLEKLTTSSWAVLLAHLPGGLSSSLRDAMMCRAVALKEVDLASLPTPPGPPCDLRWAVMRRSAALYGAVKAIADLQALLDTERYSDAREKLKAIRDQYLDDAMPISLMVRKETFMARFRIAIAGRTNTDANRPAGRN